MLAAVSFGEYSLTFVDIVGRQRHSHTISGTEAGEGSAYPGAAPTINTEFATLFSFGCMVYDSKNILLTASNLTLEITRILFI